MMSTPDPIPVPPDARLVRHPDDWTKIVPGYAVWADGTVKRWLRSRGRWAPLKPRVVASKCVIRLRVNGKGTCPTLASVVLRAWVGPRPNGFQATHYPDPDVRNNRVDNLAWAPKGFRRRGQTAHPRSVMRGSSHPKAQLSESDIVPIRNLYRAGITQQEIAEKFGVAKRTIRQVLTGQSWRHVIDPQGPVKMRMKGCTPEQSPSAKLIWDDVREIRRLRFEGMTCTQIAARFGLSCSAVRDVINRRCWKHQPSL